MVPKIRLLELLRFEGPALTAWQLAETPWAYVPSDICADADYSRATPHKLLLSKGSFPVYFRHLLLGYSVSSTN